MSTFQDKADRMVARIKAEKAAELDREERSLPFPDTGLVCPVCGEPPLTEDFSTHNAGPWWFTRCTGCPGNLSRVPSANAGTQAASRRAYRRAVAAYLLKHGDEFEQSSLAEDDREGWWPAIGGALATLVCISLFGFACVLLARYVVLAIGAFVTILGL